MEVIAQRVFDPLYMYLDIGFLILFAGLLFFKKKLFMIIDSLSTVKMALYPNGATTNYGLKGTLM